MPNTKDLFSYIIAEENFYNTTPIEIVDGYEWNMKEHIRKAVLYHNSKFTKEIKDDRPCKNIIRPILNLAHRAVGFDVKDIVLFIDDAKKHFKSFFVRKYHEKWARENRMDVFIDNMVETYCDFGGVLVKNVNEIKPEVVPWESIAFCDQTDILSGNFAIKHYFSPNQLREMAKQGWGEESNGATATIEEVIEKSEAYKKPDTTTNKKSKTTGRYVEVYEIHATLEQSYLDDSDSEDFTSQLHIVCVYKDEKGDKHGLWLFKKAEKTSPFKFLARDKIYGRALGVGGVEELEESQVWTNYALIRKKELMDSASKTIFKSTDKTFAGRNKIYNMDNLEVAILKEGTDLAQVDTYPRNINIFSESENNWGDHARVTGAANEAVMGESPKSGTPFKLQELVSAEAHSLHEFRKGKLADFLGEIYREWIIPKITKEINKGQEFIAELDMNEMQYVADSLVNKLASKMVVEKILNGEAPMLEDVELMKIQIRDSFMRGGNKKFLKIFEKEMESAPVDVQVNIAGKQKYLAAMTDKLVNVFRELASRTPEGLDDPRLAKLFNQIIESSGLEPIDFYSPPRQQMAVKQPQQPQQPQLQAGQLTQKPETAIPV